MIRGGGGGGGNSSSDSIDHSLGLGPHLVGKSIEIHGRQLEICKQLGEGGFSFVYLVRSTNTNNNSSSNSTGSNTAATATGLGENATPSSGNSSSASLSSQQLADSSNYKRQTNNPSPRLPLTGGGGSSNNSNSNVGSTPMVLKITSVHNNSQRLMAEKEAKLLQMLSHPSIIQIYDHGFREETQNSNNNHSNLNSGSGGGRIDENQTLPQQNITGNDSSNRTSKNSSTKNINNNNNSRIMMMTMKSVQHLILMEFCEGGTAFDAIKQMRLSSSSATLLSTNALTPTSATRVGGPFTNNTTTNQNSTISSSQRFDLPSLVISFGQICNAVSYLHAQRPPIIHRDLKPVNFLIKKGGAYKLCDFGSAVIGHTDLRTPENRRKAEEVVNKTTTQMFRAPEMVDLYMSKRLTQSTDVWALGCCLYSMAFLRDCFEEGSNLAILSRKYKIPEDNPYGDGLLDLIDRMLALDCKERADMSEVIMCLSALYSNRPLPQRKYATKTRDETTTVRMGAYRTDGQGIRPHHQKDPMKSWKMSEAKKLDPNSAAAKRKKASEVQKLHTSTYNNSNNKNNIAFSEEISEYGGEDGQQQNNSEKSSSPPRSAEDSFRNFASFERVFDNPSIDQIHNANADESVTKLLDDTFDSALFDEQCQISIASPSLLEDASGYVGARSGSAAEDANFEVMFQENDNSSSSPLVMLPSTTVHQISPSRRWNGNGIDRGSFPQLQSTTSGSSDTKQHDEFNSNSNVKKKRGLFGSIRGMK